VQLSLDVFVLFEGFFIITMIADIEPITIKGIAHDRPAVGQETFHKIREVQVFVWLNILQHLMFEYVDTHADLVGMYGFFDVIRNTTIGCITDDSEIDLKMLFIRSNGHKALVLLVKLEEVAIVKIGDDITIHDQKALVKVVHLSQRAHRPKGLILKAIGNIETIPLAMVDIRLNHLCHVSHREGDMRKTKVLQLPQDRIEDGLFSKGH